MFLFVQGILLVHFTFFVLFIQDNNVERAADWIFSHVDELTIPDAVPMETGEDGATNVQSKFRDGSERMLQFQSSLGLISSFIDYEPPLHLFLPSFHFLSYSHLKHGFLVVFTKVEDVFLVCGKFIQFYNVTYKLVFQNKYSHVQQQCFLISLIFGGSAVVSGHFLSFL